MILKKAVDRSVATSATYFIRAFHQRHRFVLAAFALAALTGCTLPYQQLSLPAPVTAGQHGGQHSGQHGGPGTGVVTGSVKSAVPLGNAADPGTEQTRLFAGTGIMANPGATPPSASPAPASGTVAPSVSAPSTVTGAGVSINLENARPAEAAKAILGDVLNVSYVVSDQVKGTITLNTVRPVSPDDLLTIFESVLATVDAALLVDAGVYKIVPVEEAIAAGKPLIARSQIARRGPGVTTQVIPLRYVAAAEMERILKSIAPQSTIARVDTGRNLLIVTGTANDLQSMVDTANVFDVDYMRGMSFGIFPIETSDPVAIAKELDVVFGNDKPSPTKDIVRFIPNTRLKAILVMTSRQEYLKKAETWISRIDLAGKATEKQAFVYHVQHRTAVEVASLLQKVYAPPRAQSAFSQSTTTTLTTGAVSTTDTGSTAGLVGNQTGGLAVGQGIAPVQPPPSPLAGQAPLSAASPTSSLAPPPGGDEFGDGSSEDDGTGLPPTALGAPAGQIDDRTSGISIVPDETSNAVVITATPSELRRIKQILAQIDVMPRQILIEATIAEVTLTDDLRFGLRWFFEKGSNEFRFTDSALGVIAPQFPGFSYFLNLANVQVAINALATITNVDIVSSPSLMVLDNKKAVLQIGDEVPIATQSAVGVVTPDAPIVNAISFRNTGVILSITPRVSDNDRVLLDIEQEVSDVKPTTSSTIDSPTIQQRRIKTTVTVKNGESIVLAGLMQDRATRDRDQIPLVGDIPFIGNAFKNKQDTIARTELLIAITPHVVRDDAQVGQIAAEFRDRINFSTRPQRDTPPEHRETFDRLAR